MSNLLGRPPFAIDELYRADDRRTLKGDLQNLQWSSRRKALELILQPGQAKRAVRGTFTSLPVQARFRFSELLPSWNIDLDESTQGYRMHVRVADEEQRWSPWFYLGGGGTLAGTGGAKFKTSLRWGKVDIDYLRLAKPAAWFQYRVELKSSGASAAMPAIRRFFVSYSNTDRDEQLFNRFRDGQTGPKFRPMHIKVPYRSQRTVSNRSLRGKICCPTCVSMVMEYHGVDLPTLDVAAAALDSDHGIYGAWPRASQTASLHGFEAWVHRFRSHDQVREVLCNRQPVMASIRVARGELRNAQYKTSGGHLILLVGLRANGDYIVNDPYSAGPGGAEIDYAAEDIEKVWLEKGGVGILIRPPGAEK
jgi:hypothetical protein